MFDHVRRIFADTPLARRRHYSPGRFSFNVAQGRCPVCEGEGYVMVKLLFLPSVDHWQIIRIPNLGPVLAGWVRSHPVLGPSDCWFISTPLERIDPAGKWAWSKNHLFRLLRPADPLKEAERLAETLNHPRKAHQMPVEQPERDKEPPYDQTGFEAF